MQSLNRYLLVTTAASALLFGADPTSHSGWAAYLGGPDSDQYTSLKQITKANVKQLEIAWTYPTGEKGNYLFNPIVIDGVMYVLAKNNSIVALDAATGKELWSHENQGAVGNQSLPARSGAGRATRKIQDVYRNEGLFTPPS